MRPWTYENDTEPSRYVRVWWVNCLLQFGARLAVICAADIDLMASSWYLKGKERESLRPLSCHLSSSLLVDSQFSLALLAAAESRQNGSTRCGLGPVCLSVWGPAGPTETQIWCTGFSLIFSSFFAKRAQQRGGWQLRRNRRRKIEKKSAHRIGIRAYFSHRLRR